MILKNESIEEADLSLVSVGGLLEALLSRIEAKGGDFSRDTGDFFQLLGVAQSIYGLEVIRPYEVRFDQVIEEKQEREYAAERANIRGVSD